jgi:VanZ family protein
MKTFALLFLLIILLVIVAADLDAIPPVVRDLYRFPGGDLLGHFVLYGLLAYLLARAFPRPLRLGRFSIPIIVLPLLALIALEEFSQSFFAARTASFSDLAFSFLGVSVGTWLARQRQRAIKTPPAV